MLQLSQHHGAVLHLVVELEALDEVLVGARVLGLLHLAVDREELDRTKKAHNLKTITLTMEARIERDEGNITGEINRTEKKGI